MFGEETVRHNAMLGAAVSGESLKILFSVCNSKLAHPGLRVKLGVSSLFRTFGSFLIELTLCCQCTPANPPFYDIGMIKALKFPTCFSQHRGSLEPLSVHVLLTQVALEFLCCDFLCKATY